jgi:hypothetical protein
MTSKDQLSIAVVARARWKWLLRSGSLAALSLIGLFLIGITSLMIVGAQPPASGWDMSLRENWLVVLFKLNRSSGSGPAELLQIIHLVDLLIMALFEVLFVSLYAVLHRFSRVWTAIAASLPFLGVLLLLITRTAGRSGLLIGGLIFSIIMLRSGIFSKPCANVGIMASALLFFIGDLATALLPSSTMIALGIGIGYILWIVWFFLTGIKLFQLSSKRPPAA